MLKARLDEALALCQAGAFQEAESIYRELTQAHGDAPDAWNMLAVVLYQQGAFEEALLAAERATALRPGIAPYWLMRGNVALARKHWAEAQASFTRALDIEPDFAEAHYRLGLAYHGDHRYREAISAYREAVRLVPDVAEIHWQLAEALIAAERMSEAVRAYQEAYSRDPQCLLDRRGCLEWLARLHFDALPAFWHAELERFFARDDIEVSPYVGAGIKALKTRPAYRTVFAREAAGGAIVVDAALLEALRDPLLHTLLAKCLMADAQFERWLTGLRERLLRDPTARTQAPIELLHALALQSFNNEFVFAESAEETAAVDVLQREIEDRLQSQKTPEPRALLTLACYRRLDRVAGIDTLLAPGNETPGLRRLLERSVIEPRAERALRTQIATIVETRDALSLDVRSMYEEHPYPRWFAIDREAPMSLAEWVERELPALPQASAARAPRVLVAGCGTGKDALWIASNIVDSTVLGVDLSLASLAYARRMANALGVANIELRQGDILRLPALEARFDLIASTGVLHHMRDPLAGLRSIASLLAPGGLMKLGFYSARARKSVTAAREIIAAENIAANEAQIRMFRQRVFAEDVSSPLKELEHSNDFYSMSMCRDLLFHVQEHQYTLRELGAMLDDVGLELLGLAELAQDTVARYRSLYPHDAAMVDIASWDAYEAQYPETFSSMFLLWCRRRESQ